MSIVTLAVAATSIVLGVASGDVQIAVAALCGGCGIATLVGTPAPLSMTERPARRLIARSRAMASKTHL